MLFILTMQNTVAANVLITRTIKQLIIVTETVGKITTIARRTSTSSTYTTTTTTITANPNYYYYYYYR